MADLIPYSDRDGFIWWNGEMVPWRDATLHMLSHGLHYASAVFEGERAYGGQIFKLTEHSQRLVDGARVLDFEIPYQVEEIDAACNAVVKANNLSDCYVRPLAWRGSEMMGVSAQQTKINLAIAAWDWGSYFPIEQRLKGIRVTFAKYRRPDPMTAPSCTKATGLYMVGTIEKHRAEQGGFAEALMLDWRGRVAECTSGNIFFVKGTELHSPTPDCFLDGITRRTVIELAKKRGYTCTDRIIMPEELGSFDECFMVGTAAEVTPIAEIDAYTFTPGEVCKALIEDYTAAVQPGQGGQAGQSGQGGQGEAAVAAE
ncbi:MAG: branched-chain amino acid aminotransferase [Pseudomonadota bacterium]